LFVRPIDAAARSCHARWSSSAQIPSTVFRGLFSIVLFSFSEFWYTSVMSRPVGRINRQNVPTLKARSSPRNPAGPFADLTWPQQRAAEAWLFKFCQRWGSDLPSWRRAILIGTAKRLALHPPAANFGHVLKAAKGGLALARKCKAAGVMMPGAITLHALKKAGRPALPSRQLEV
jgi:hypothetical protein